MEANISSTGILGGGDALGRGGAETDVVLPARKGLLVVAPIPNFMPGFWDVLVSSPLNGDGDGRFAPLPEKDCRGELDAALRLVWFQESPETTCSLSSEFQPHSSSSEKFSLRETEAISISLVALKEQRGGSEIRVGYIHIYPLALILRTLLDTERHVAGSSVVQRR
jgi:hypothetical protein